MELALEEAHRGALEGEVPVGAALLCADQIVATAHNRPIALCDPTAHAEILALREAASKLGCYRLVDGVLVVTLEPCVMCVGAILNARLKGVVFGARDEKAGALGSVFDIGRDGRLNHRIEVRSGLYETQCAALLREFFRVRR